MKLCSTSIHALTWKALTLFSCNSANTHFLILIHSTHGKETQPTSAKEEGRQERQPMAWRTSPAETRTAALGLPLLPVGCGLPSTNCHSTRGMRPAGERAAETIRDLDTAMHSCQHKMGVYEALVVPDAILDNVPTENSKICSTIFFSSSSYNLRDTYTAF